MTILPMDPAKLPAAGQALFAALSAKRKARGADFGGPYVALLNHPELARRIEDLGFFLKFEGVLRATPISSSCFRWRAQPARPSNGTTMCNTRSLPDFPTSWLTASPTVRRKSFRTLMACCRRSWRGRCRGSLFRMICKRKPLRNGGGRTGRDRCALGILPDVRGH
jgi:hypothetical protein